jgi:transcriptional/translational regulatory protein YebC/TACO1
MGIKIRTSGLERLPTRPIELTEAQLEEVQALIDKIEENDDVQVVYTNLG